MNCVNGELLQWIACITPVGKFIVLKDCTQEGQDTYLYLFVVFCCCRNQAIAYQPPSSQWVTSRLSLLPFSDAEKLTYKNSHPVLTFMKKIISMNSI